jgi:putative DNA primase/helicase
VPNLPEIARSFQDAIAVAGLNPPQEIIGDGRLHRFATNGKAGDKSGWYVLHTNGNVPAGAFGD